MKGREMGVDLTLCPLIGKDFWAAHTRLELNRRRALWDEVNFVPQQDVPEPVSGYWGDEYKKSDKDAYGERLRFAKAGDLMAIKDHEAISDDWENSAVWAYLSHLPKYWPIILYWH